jgi:hypothetical protein
MKVGQRGVQCNKYNGRCAYKQWIKIWKATWTSPNLGRRSTCRTSSNKVFFMKDDLNDEVPNDLNFV